MFQQRYRYEVIRISQEGIPGNPLDAYPELLNEKGAQGWRLVAVATPPDYLAARYAKGYVFDLIFERLED
jgi:hypothetical protein